MSKEEIAKQLVDKYIKSFGDTEIPIDEMYYNESKSDGIMMRNFLEDFAEDILDQQTKALTDEIDQLNKDYSILNDQFVKSKEWNLEIVYSNKFKDKEIKQLQARIDELEKALKESVIVLNGVDFSLFYKDEEEKANKLINKIYQLTEPTNK